MKVLPVAGVVMFGAVALGALGAHALEFRLEAAGHQTTWQTAVLYHAIHGLALFALGIWQFLDSRTVGLRWLAITGWLWLVGIAGFSGSLYGLSLGGPGWLGPVTPLGGLCFLAGWAVLAVGAWRAGHAGGKVR